MKRREFLQSVVGAGTALGGLAAVAERARPEAGYPFSTLEEAMRAARFNPRRRDSFTTVWTADLH
jgi:hypothetical protein